MNDSMPLLGPILGATVVAPDLDALTAAYRSTFGYRVVEEGTVSAALADSWGAPSAGAARTRLLGPRPTGPGLVRVVEQPGSAPDGAYLRRPGWRAIEICVTDVHALRERLDGTPFRVVGEPAAIPGSETIHALQAIGPAGELLYLTEVGAQSVYELPRASAPVDRVFIAVLSAPDLAQARAYYEQRFGGGGPRGEISAPIRALNHELGLAPDHEHTFCAIQLREQSLVEVDQHPRELLAERAPATVADGPLPAGVGLMTFAVDALPSDPIAAPVRAEGALYGGRRSVVVAGPAGERIELVERVAD